MALNQTFIDALMQMRRKATLQGRPMAQAETAGVTEGMAMSASDRLAKAASASQGQQQIDISRKGLDGQMLRNEQMLNIANKVMRQERYKNYATTGLISLAEAPKIIKGAQQVGGLLGDAAKWIAKLF